MPSYEADAAEFERHDAQVLGISVDSIPCHAAFAKSLGGIETFPLLADFHPKGAVGRLYGIWKDAHGVSERAIFIADKKGRIAYIDIHEISEKPENEQLFEILRKLPQT